MQSEVNISSCQTDAPAHQISEISAPMGSTFLARSHCSHSPLRNMELAANPVLSDISDQAGCICGLQWHVKRLQITSSSCALNAVADSADPLVLEHGKPCLDRMIHEYTSQRWQALPENASSKAIVLQPEILLSRPETCKLRAGCQTQTMHLPVSLRLLCHQTGHQPHTHGPRGHLPELEG